MREKPKNFDLTVVETEAKSLLRQAKKIDSWFLSRYNMNIYRGCQHDCSYCDGRTEKYQVEGSFGQQVTVKTNAGELLARELDPQRRRKPLIKGFIGLGGGVGDAYQPLEKKYKLTRKILSLIKKNGFPVHILTKSTLVERDLDIIGQINKKESAMVSMSFSSVDDAISKIFEPKVSVPSQRLKTLAAFKQKGILGGMYLMPVIPFITDAPDMMENCFKRAAKINLDFITVAGMTLKPGRQKDTFYKILNKHYPDLIPQYEIIYQDKKWGSPTSEYIHSFNQFLLDLSEKYNLPLRIPVTLFKKWMPVKDRIVVTLEHLDYLTKLRGQKSSYGYAAYSISQLKSPLTDMRHSLTSIKGVGNVTERIILDILNTGSSSYYDHLMGLN